MIQQFGLRPVQRLYKQFSAHERFLTWILALLAILGAVLIVSSVQRSVSTSVPRDGGTYTEGIVGFPRHVNPVLATTNADRDVTALVYAGLTKKTEDGRIVPDMAKDYTVNDNHTAFTFRIARDASFHDGHPLQAEDVAYTIQQIKNPSIDSPRRSRWQDVTVEVINEKTVRFTTDEPFPNLPANATVGILPKHRWSAETSQSFAFSELNTRPIGSGPYQLKQVKENADGLPTKYTLTAFSSYVGKQPHLNTIKLHFFPNSKARRQAYESNRFSGMYGLDPAYATQLDESGKRVAATQYNRVFSVFFNQDENKALVDQSVRQALSASIPRETIIETALAGYGKRATGPLPPELMKQVYATSSPSAPTTPPAQLLTQAGWSTSTASTRTKDGEKLSVTLTTANVPNLTKTANLIKQAWETLGVAVEIQTVPSAQLTRDVIRPRDYEALLFGQSVNDLHDLYAFWHSSRQDDPGLNLARYTNSDADQYLERLRTATSTQNQQQLARQFIDELRADQPAAFLFSPSFLYVLPNSLQGVTLPRITHPADRFADVSEWHADTQLLWNVFVDKKNQ